MKLCLFLISLPLHVVVLADLLLLPPLLLLLLLLLLPLLPNVTPAQWMAMRLMLVNYRWNSRGGLPVVAAVVVVAVVVLPHAKIQCLVPNVHLKMTKVL